MKRLIPLALVLAAWEAASASGLLPKAVLPAVSDVARALASLLISGEILPHTAASFGRAGAGLFIAVVAGVTLGVLMARFRIVERTVEPILLIIYPVPKPALIPLARRRFCSESPVRLRLPPRTSPDTFSSRDCAVAGISSGQSMVTALFQSPDAATASTA